MKILHLVQGYTPAIGGTEYLVQKISEKLVGNFNDDVTVFTTFGYNIEHFINKKARTIGRDHENEVINGVKVKRFNVINQYPLILKYLYGLSYYLRLPFWTNFQVMYRGPLSPKMKKAVQKAKPDIIMSSSFPLMHMYYALEGKKNNIPVVLHGGLHIEDQQNYNTKKVYAAIEKCDAYIANTASEKEYLVKKGILPDKIHIIGVGVDIDPNPEKRKGVFRNKYNINKDEVVIAFIGQQSLHKGILTLIRSFSKLYDYRKNIRLVIAGAPTKFLYDINKEINNLNDDIKKRIIHLGKITESEKRNILADCDMFSSPSCRESFGITYLEAWSYKKPVIGCGIVAVSSVVNEYENGLLVNFNDSEALTSAFLEIIDDPIFCKKLGENGYQKVINNYTWDIVTNKFREVYKRVIKK